MMTKRPTKKRRIKLEAVTLERVIHIALLQAEIAGDDELYDVLLRALGIVLRRHRERRAEWE